jgi:hypothetical protein
MKQIITFLLLAVFTTVLSAQTVNILGDPYGGNPYTTIADAIFAANDGDVILITGVHTESIAFNKSITLRGTDPTTDIIQAAATASSDGSGSRVINISRAEVTDVLTITIENLGVRHGNDANNGGGINVDKVTGQLTLKNLIIENNHTDKNGGGVNIAGTNANIIECTIQNNTATLDGGGIAAAPNDGAPIHCDVNMEQSLIDSNIGRNGGGIYLNGNKTFGDAYKIDLRIENSTISNNSTTSGTSGAGGGAIWSKAAIWTVEEGGDGTSSNTTLSLVHATVYNNTHSSAVKNGLNFTGDTTVNFSAYNSIIVTADVASQKALSLAGANTINMVNCILGGLDGAAGSLGVIDDVAKNNKKGKTATFAGLSSSGLSDEGGPTLVLAISDGSNADDYCTATPGISLPTVDQRGYTREATPDAGAYEFGGTLSLETPIVLSNVKVYPNPASEFVYVEGINQIESIEVFSVLGVLEKTIIGKNYLDTSELSSGIYLLKIENNSSSITKRLVVN